MDEGGEVKVRIKGGMGRGGREGGEIQRMILIEA